ncbi:MAG: ABC transporter permease [Clostridiales bacterium]|nr:ABC transporter permease [Clostridiales bacterium]
MKFLDMLRMSCSSLWKRKVRTILTVLGVVIGTASIVVMVSLGLGLNKATMEEINQNGGLTTINVYQSGGGAYGYEVDFAGESGSKDQEEKRLDAELVETIRNLPYVENVSPVLSVNALAKYGMYECYLNIQGMQPEALEAMGIPVGEGELPKAGEEKLRFFYGNLILQDFSNAKTGEGYWMTGVMPDIDLMTDPMFVIFDMDAYYQSQSGGDSSTQPVAPPKKYLVEACGVAAGGPEDYRSYSWSVYCDINTLEQQLKKIFKNKAIPGQPTTKTGKPYKELYYNSIYVDVDSMEHVKEVQQRITEMGYQANSNAEWVESMQKQFANVQAVLGGIGAVSLLVAAIGITNTMMMSIYERTKEIGVMKVLGCDLRNIQMLFLMEAGFIGFIGGVIGLMLSEGISLIINKVIEQSGNTSMMSYIPPWLAGASILFAVVVGMAAGFFPSLRAMRLSPLAAIRNE